jgi:uncharacterized protein (TIGR00369 family)
MSDANDRTRPAAQAAARADLPDKPIPDSMGGAAELLDIEIVEMSDEKVVATMPVTPKHHQPFGVLHGGVSVVLAESVASVGAYLAAPDGFVAMGIEINANHIRAVREGTVTAVATPVHRGRSTQVWQVEITGENDKLICVSRCTLAIVKKG